MRYETNTVRVGEKVSEIDWTHETLQRTGDEWKDRNIQSLRDLEDALRHGGSARVTSHGGDCWMFCMKDVVDVGMYDGWPYWQPNPSVLTRGPLGHEWHSIQSLNHFSIKPSGA